MRFKTLMLLPFVLLVTAAWPQSTEAEFITRGNNYLNSGDYDRAIADYTQAIRLAGTDPVGYYNRGIAFQRKKDYASSIQDYPEALRLKPGYLEVLVARGNAYDDHDRAIQDYTQAIRL